MFEERITILSGYYLSFIIVVFIVVIISYYLIISLISYRLITALFVNGLILNQVRQLKSVSKLHANTSSPDVYCQTSFELAVPYGTNATGNLTNKGLDTAKPVRIIQLNYLYFQLLFVDLRVNEKGRLLEAILFRFQGLPYPLKFC